MEAQDGNAVRIGSLELLFLVDETSSSGSLVMFEFLVPPNARVPAPHFHKEVDEVVYALEGTTTTTLDGQKHELRAGQRSEEHTSELQSRQYLVCRLLLEKKQNMLHPDI